VLACSREKLGCTVPSLAGNSALKFQRILQRFQNLQATAAQSPNLFGSQNAVEKGKFGDIIAVSGGCAMM
jgi:hypothetical protein